MIESETGMMFIDPTQIEMIPIEKLKCYKRNAKKHTPEQIEQIVNSIKAFGMNDPIAVWGDENVIVEGHGRYLALRSIGEQGDVPCIRLDHLTDEQRKAYALAHNQLTMNTGWDDELLLPELDELGDFFDMADFGFGFDDEETGNNSTPAEIVEDDAPEVDEVEPCCKRGQVWVLGCHRLMCGDSTNRSDADKLLGGVKADMVFTDPPYGVNYAGGATIENGKIKSNGRETIRNDALGYNGLYKFLSDVFTNLRECTKAKAAFYIFYAHTRTREFLNAFHDAGLKQRSIIIWRKIGGGFGDFMAQYMNAYEPCIYGSNGESVNWYGPTNEKTVWEFEKAEKNDLHPTMKPVALVARAIENSTNKGDTVLDLFGGSGTTLIAAEQTGRKCLMMELDPKYCDVIIRRWEDFTGQKAELLEG